MQITQRVVTAAALVIGLLVPSAPTAAASACEPFMQDRAAITDVTLDVPRASVITREVVSPPDSELIVIAKESGVDADVVVSAGGRILARGGSPISRTGVVRLAFKTPKAAKLSIQISSMGKDSGTGVVRVRAIVIGNDVLEDPCVQIQEAFAAADEAYSEGRTVTLGGSRGGNTDAAHANRSATEHYLHVVKMLESSPASEIEAYAEHSLAATFYDSLQDWTTAQRWAQQAAATYGQIGQEYERARAQAVEAAARMEIALTFRSEPGGGRQKTNDTLQQARDQLKSVAGFHAQRGETFDRALAQNNIGLAYYYEGRNAEAIETYRGALTLFNQLDEGRWKKITLQNIALADYELGRVSDAIALYGEVLRLMSTDDDPLVRASVLNNCAIANRVSGNLDVALQQYTSALELERQSQNPREQARSLHGIGVVYEMLGDQQLAQEIYQQALSLLTVELDARGRTASLRSLGNVLRAQGKVTEALAAHEEALPLAPTNATRAQIRIQLARDFEALGRDAAALTELNAVIDDPFTGGDIARAEARMERGQLHARTGRITAAETDLRAAITVLRTRDAPTVEFAAWLELARLQRRRNSINAALSSVNHALDLADEVRLQSANPELRAALLQPLRPAFDLKISLLETLYSARAAAGVEREALAMRALLTSERARARALEDFERFDISRPNLDPQLVERRRTLYRELASRHFLLEARRDRSGDDDAKARAIRVDIAALRAQLAQMEAQITPPGGSAQHWSKLDLHLIPRDTAIVEYWLGATDAIAWVLTRDHLTMVRLLDTETIRRAATAFANALRAYGTVTASVRMQASTDLSALVVDAIAPALAGTRKLIIAPDDILHYVPFAALRADDGRRTRFLVESYDVSTTPSARSLLLPRANLDPRPASESSKLLLVADPVYSRDDERFQPPLNQPAPVADRRIWERLFRGESSAVSLTRLAGTAREASLIKSRLPRARVDVLEGFAASKDRFLNSRLEQYRLIHVASHATTDAEIPGLSALILSTLDSSGKPVDGRVLAADLVTRHINADLVVLSACDTALGKNIVGEGLMGLQYIVQARGARSVISSLWEVPDDAAAAAMDEFYAAYLTRSLPVGSALSEAMRRMLTGRFSDPGEWAAFNASISDLRMVR